MSKDLQFLRRPTSPKDGAHRGSDKKGSNPGQKGDWDLELRVWMEDGFFRKLSIAPTYKIRLSAVRTVVCN